MKKLISILLAAMLIIGMFPAITASAEEMTATLSFADKAQRTSFSSTQQVWAQNGITFTNDKASSTSAVADYANPVRLYAKSSITVGFTSAMSKIVFTCSSSSYATALKNSADASASASATASGSTVTIDLSAAPAASYTIASLTAQVRIKELTVYYDNSGAGEETPCEHANQTLTSKEVAATCTEEGQTAIYTCDDCGEPTGGEKIDALGHNYVDGICDREGCGAEEPSLDIPESGTYTLVTDLADLANGGKFVVVANHSDKNYAMGLGTSGKLPAAEVSAVDGVIYTEDPATWIIAPTGTGYSIYNETAGKYLSYGSSGTSFSSSDDPYTWTATVSNGKFLFTSAAATTRAVAYTSSNSGQFGAYATSNTSNASYQFYLSLYKLTAGEVEVAESTLTFVEQGVTTNTATAQVAAAYNLPNATKEAPAGYTFAGWVTEHVDNSQIAPENIFAAGAGYTVSNDETFYALYTCTKTDAAGEIYQLVTDTTGLAIGDKVVIAAAESDFALSTTQNSNNRGQAKIVKDGATITFDEGGVQILTLVQGNKENTFGLYTGAGYLYAASGSSNHLKTDDALTDNGSWAITVTDGVASVVAQGTNARNVMQHNASSKLFSCYGSASQKAVALYKSVPGSVEKIYYTTCFHSFVSGTEDQVVCTYCGAAKTAAASANGTNFETLEDAVANAAGGVVTLYQNAGAIEAAGALYLDLNGFNVESVTAQTLYACDSKASVYAASGAKISAVTGDVTMDYTTADGKRYIALETDGAYTVHCLELKLSAVSLRTSSAGIYYKAKAVCDSKLAGAVDSYGIILSTDGMPYQLADGKYTTVEGQVTSNTAFLSGSVFNIFKEGLSDAQNIARGKTTIFANAYLNIDGTILVAYQQVNAERAVWTMQKVLQTVDDQLGGKLQLDEAQAEVLADFYDKWANEHSVITDWALNKISELLNG